MIGGCGFCTGFGQNQLFSMLTMSPWYSASSCVHSALIASTRSRNSVQRVSKAVPWSPISSRFQPPPMPNRKRPLERRSRLAASLAVWMGSRSMRRQMPVPIRSVFEASAAAVSAMNGSIVCMYIRGSSPPAG